MHKSFIIILYSNKGECIFYCCKLYDYGVFQLVKTTVAQVLEAKDMKGGRPGWSCLGCGVVCLIEDEFVHSHFLHLYCVKVRGTAELIRDAPPTHISTHAETWLPLPSTK